MAFAISSTVLLAIRAVQALFALIVLGLMGHVASWWNGAWHASSPSQINFNIFSSVWTLLALAYLILVPMRFSNTVLHHKFAILAVESVTMLFWFAGLIATAVFLTGRICLGAICNTAKAGDVFSAFEWLLFAVTTAFAVLHLFSSSRSTVGTTKEAKHPGMVQEGV